MRRDTRGDRDSRRDRQGQPRPVRPAGTSSLDGPSATGQLELPLEPLAVSVREATRLSGIGRSTLYALMGSKRLDYAKVGRSRLVLVPSLKRLLAPIRP